MPPNCGTSAWNIESENNQHAERCNGSANLGVSPRRVTTLNKAVSIQRHVAISIAEIEETIARTSGT